MWRNYLHVSELPWLSGQVVDGRTVYPGAGYLANSPWYLRRFSKQRNDQLPRMRAKLLLNSNCVQERHGARWKRRGWDRSSHAAVSIPHASSAKSVHASWFRFSVVSFGEGNVMVEHCHGMVCAKIGPKAKPVPASEDSASRTRTESSGLSFDDLQKLTTKRKTSELYYSQLSTVGLNYNGPFRLLAPRAMSSPAKASRLQSWRSTHQMSF